MKQPIEIREFAASEDSRGMSFHFPDEFVSDFGALYGAHFVTLLPGAVRGNHAHSSRRELLMIPPSNPCTLMWQEDGKIKTFDVDPTLVTIAVIEAGIVHSIRNLGDYPVGVFSAADRPPRQGDTRWETLASSQL